MFTLSSVNIYATAPLFYVIFCNLFSILIDLQGMFVKIKTLCIKVSY